MKTNTAILAALEAILVKVGAVPAEHRPSIDGEMNELRKLMQDGSETACAIVPDDDLSPDEDGSSSYSDLQDDEKFTWNLVTGKFFAWFYAYKNGLPAESLLDTYDDCQLAEDYPSVVKDAWRVFINHLLETMSEGHLEETEVFAFILTTDIYLKDFGASALEGGALELKVLAFHLKGRTR